MVKIFAYVFLSLSLFIFVFFLGSYFWVKDEIYRKKTINPPVSLEIKRGTSLKEISKLLKEKGIIDNSFVFYIYARYK
ncbi:MAG: hypothetical protein D6831_00450, partial [Aquificota bacterium]